MGFSWADSHPPTYPPGVQASDFTPLSLAAVPVITAQALHQDSVNHGVTPKCRVLTWATARGIPQPVCWRLPHLLPGLAAPGDLLCAPLCVRLHPCRRHPAVC